MKKSSSRKTSSKKNNQVEHFNLTLDRLYIIVILLLLIILFFLYTLCKKCINKSAIYTQ